MLFVVQTLVFGLLCKALIKEMFALGLIALRGKRILEIVVFLYFFIVWIFFRNGRFSFLYLLLILICLLCLLVYLKQQEEKTLLLQLFSMLIPLESQMKLGLSFINAWNEGIKELKSKKNKCKMIEIAEILKFQNIFHYPDKDIENFVRDLIQIHQSSNPLRRLQHLQRKVRIEKAFRVKSKRVLLQVRLQSTILSVFYMGVLAWTFMSYGTRYLHLILISFLLFCAGLFWIFKTGRVMKWSV